jgi:hypothetical protein
MSLRISIKGKEFIAKLRDYQLPKKGSAAWS